jgi:hypothetical protein
MEGWDMIRGAEGPAPSRAPIKISIAVIGLEGCSPLQPLNTSVEPVLRKC